MKPTLFKTLQFVVANLGIGTLRLKQPYADGSIPPAVNPHSFAAATPALVPTLVADPESGAGLVAHQDSSPGERKAATASAAMQTLSGSREGGEPESAPERFVAGTSGVYQIPVSGPQFDQTQSFSLQLARLARGTGFDSPGETPSGGLAEQQERLRTLAVGFPVAQQNRLKQDFAGAFDSEIDFVTLDGVAERKGEAREAALILINIASVAVTRRLARQFLELLDAGRPTLFTGSRAALKSLGVLVNHSTAGWDYVPVPWDRDELIWRLQRLTQWEPLAIATPVPKRKPVASATRPQALLSSGELISRAC